MKNNLIQEQSRGIYDIKDKFEYDIKTEKGLNENIIREISEIKKEPKWVLEARLKAFKIFLETQNPSWGPNLEDIDFDQMVSYIKPKAESTNNWEDLPEYIKNTFDRLRNTGSRKRNVIRSFCTI